MSRRSKRLHHVGDVCELGVLLTKSLPSRRFLFPPERIGGSGTRYNVLYGRYVGNGWERWWGHMHQQSTKRGSEKNRGNGNGGGVVVFVVDMPSLQEPSIMIGYQFSRPSVCYQ